MANGYGISDSIFGDKGFYKSDPVGNFNFILTVEGIYDIPLKGVRAFQKVNQFERIREGGVNDYVHLKRAPIQDAHTIQFERYVSGTLFDPLANGAELAIPVILWLKRAANNGLTDAVAADKMDQYTADDYDTSSVRLYVFTGCVVMSKEYGALDAEHSGLATEVVTMAYKELYIVPNLYTFFGGGTDVKSWGQGGELTIVDEKAREDFKKQQKIDYDNSVAAHQKAAEAAEKKAQEDRTKAEEYRAKANAEAEAYKAEKKAEEEQQKKKAAEEREKAKQDAINQGVSNRYKAQDKAAEERASAKEESYERDSAKDFKNKQQAEYEKAQQQHQEAAKKAEEKAQADKVAADGYRAKVSAQAKAETSQANAKAQQDAINQGVSNRNKPKN